MHDIWNPWHGCRKYSEGCQNCYMYYLDAMRGKHGSDIYKVKTKFNYPIQKGAGWFVQDQERGDASGVHDVGLLFKGGGSLAPRGVGYDLLAAGCDLFLVDEKGGSDHGMLARRLGRWV